MVSRDIWDKYRLMIFQNSPNITRRFAARDILVNFEISLAVFIPNTPRNHAQYYLCKLDDTKSCYQLIIKITVSEKRRIAKL